MYDRAAVHQPWCAEDCAAEVTAVHTSRPVPVAPEGAELMGLAVHLEQLITPAPVNLVAIEFVVDSEATAYLMPPRQAQVLHRVISVVLRRLPSVS
jgi:hypothetical protein